MTNPALRTRYLAESVATASPGQLLVMLYDRLVVDLTQAEDALRARDTATASTRLMHAQDIVSQLRSTLDPSARDGAAGPAGRRPGGPAAGSRPAPAGPAPARGRHPQPADRGHPGHRGRTHDGAPPGRDAVARRVRRGTQPARIRRLRHVNHTHREGPGAERRG